MNTYKSFFSRLISLYYPVLCMIWWIKEGHRFVDILLIKNWTLSALPFTLGWPMPILTNGEQWKWWYSSPRCNLYKDWQLPPWSLGDPSLHVRSLTTCWRDKRNKFHNYMEKKRSSLEPGLPLVTIKSPGLRVKWFCSLLTGQCTNGILTKDKDTR